jgi:hypothetical protein
MIAPNILLRVKHDTSRQGKVFGKETYDHLREQLSNLVRAPYAIALKEVWCENADHHLQETVITIDAADSSYEITEACCTEYGEKVRQALAGKVERVRADKDRYL